MFAADGRGWTLRTLNVPALTPEVAKAIVAAVQNKPSPNDVINIHHFHGVATRIALESAAFGQRQEHLMVEIISGWRDDGPALHERWADETMQALGEYALPGGYPNLLGPDAHAQIVQAYGSNAGRLRAVKQKYDPQGVFTAIPLP
jgi:FAD/FMN-containing dehydrogenase